MIRPFRIRKTHSGNTLTHARISIPNDCTLDAVSISNWIYHTKRHWSFLFDIDTIRYIRHIYTLNVSHAHFSSFFQYRRALPPKITITLSFYMHAMLSDYVCATLTNQFSMLFTQTSSVQTKQTKKFDDFATTNRRAINKYLFKFYNILNCCDAIERNWRTILRKNALNLFYQPERFFSSS